MYVYIHTYLHELRILKDFFYDIKIWSKIIYLKNIFSSKDNIKADNHIMREYIGHTCN